VMIGDGYLGQSLRQRVNAERCPANSSVTASAHRARLDVPRPVFCAPSVHASNGDSEAWHGVHRGAGCGTPVVSFDHAESRGVLDKVTGLLAPERDSTMLAAYSKISFRSKPVAEFSRRGIENAKNRFDIVTKRPPGGSVFGAIAEFKPA